MKFLSFIATLLFLSLGLTAYGQGFKMSRDKYEFIEDISKALLRSKDSTMLEIGADIGGLYASLTETQRDTMYSICWVMYDKKYRLGAQFLDFFKALNGAIGVKVLKREQVDDYLNVTLRVLRELKLTEINTYLRTTKDFLTNYSLYYSKFNQLITTSENFKIQWAESAPEPDFIPETESPKPTTEEDFFKQFDNTDADLGWSGNFDDPISKSSENGDIGSILESFEPPTSDLPTISGPVLIFDEPVDLEMRATFDNAIIRQTTGTLMLSNFLFVGKGGTFDWSTVELAEDEVYVELGEYSFNIMNPRLSAEGVKLNYDKYLYEPIEGTFSFNSVKKKNPSEKPFPRFMSYESNIQLKEIGDGVTYKGGFTLIGQKIFSSSVREDLSYISVTYDAETKFRANSPRFEITDTALLAEVSSVVVYTDKDSIYNPVVAMVYGKEMPDLSLYPPKGAYRYHPYKDTYHKFYITAEKLYYDFTQDSLEFSTYRSREVLPVVIESEDYFRPTDFDQFKRNTTYNILHLAVLFANKNKSDFYYLGDFASQYNMKTDIARDALDYLSSKGFIRFNQQAQTIKVLPRAFHFFSSNQGRKDFDNIQILSYATDDANVRINIRDQSMVIRGVKDFAVSDSLNVTIEPLDGVMDIVDRRNIEFNGKLTAGNYVFSGEKFRFSYDSFLVDMVQIDSIDFIVRSVDTTDNRLIAKKLLNNLQRTSGILYINEVSNKSGKKRIERYPTFDLDAPAYVYFNNPSVLNGAYDERIYFEVPPFGLDSLSSDDPSTISFEGKMFSNGLFPDFEYTIRVMPDLSLGFDYDLPPEGFEVYNGKAKLYNNLKLDNKGFTSNGEVNYMAAKAKSDQFVFYQDSLITVGTELTTLGTQMDGHSFAKSSIKGYQMSWLVEEDSMIIRNLKSPFEMYDGSSRFRGEMILSKARGMIGIGRWEDKNAIVKANDIRFGEERFLAEEGVFQIKSEDPYKPALFAHDINVDYEFTARQATFIPVYEGEATIEFPFMQYKTSIPKGVWDFDKNTVTMSVEDPNDVDYSYFYSTKPEQDSLVFNAEKGVYDIKTSTLTISGIPYIQVADALITPDQGTVVVRENAEMDQLQNARIVADTLNEYHTLTKGTIDIISRYKFQGRADYRFANIMNDTFDIIFDDFESEYRKGIPSKSPFGGTLAKGRIEEDEPITIGPKILFKGDVTMRAYKPQLEFNGFVKLDINSTEEDENSTDWFAFNSAGETEEIVLNTEGLTSQNGLPLVTGLHIQSGSSLLYNTFVATRSTPTDQDVVTAEGDLIYDPDENEFTVGYKPKLNGQSMTGNVVVYEDKTRRLRYEGKFTFVHDNTDIQVNAAGSGEAALDSGIYRFNSFITIGFNAPSNLFMVMGDRVDEVVKNMSADEAVEDGYLMLYRLAEIIGEDKAKQWDVGARSGYTPLLTSSSKISNAITLPEVNLEWNEENRAWRSVGKLGVSNIYKKDINAKMDGYLEIKKLMDGEAVYLYLQPTLDTWYYFSYDRKVLSMVSSKRNFNDLVLARTKGSEPAPSTYGLRLADISEKKDFVREFKSSYLKYSESQIQKEEQEQETAEIEADNEGQLDDDYEEEASPDPFFDQPVRKAGKKEVEIDPFTGEPVETDEEEPTDKKSQILKEKDPVKKRYEIDPFTGERVEIVEEVQPVEEVVKEKVKKKKTDLEKKTQDILDEADPFTDEPAQKKKSVPTNEIDPFTGEPIEEKPAPVKKKVEIDPFTGEPIEAETSPEESEKKEVPSKKSKKSSDKEENPLEEITDKPSKKESKKKDTAPENVGEVDPFTGEPIKPSKKETKPKVDQNIEVDPFTGEPLQPTKKEPVKEEKPKEEKKVEEKPKAKPAVEIDPFTGEPIESDKKEAPKVEPKKEEPKKEPVKEEKPKEEKKVEEKPKAKPAVEIDPFTGEPIESDKKEAPKVEPKKEEPKKEPVKEEKPKEEKKVEEKPKAKPAVEIDPFTGEPTEPVKSVPKSDTQKETPKEDPKPKQEDKKKPVEVDPFTGEPITPDKKEVPKKEDKKKTKKVEIDPFTGEPIDDGR